MSGAALSQDTIDLLLEKMYVEKGWDFRRYRRSSIKRCIERRITLSRLPYHGYINLLDSEPSEFNNLFNHITIKVSEFFRDPEVFRYIDDYVIPATLQRLKARGKTAIRIWSCGCARGEEAYSTAILLHKISGTINEDLDIKIFATDIDEAAVDMGRRGIFNDLSLKNVNSLHRSNFFHKIDGNLQVIPQIRNLITFGVHNIITHIHLSHIDIILCRNLLIYFEKELQEKVFEKFLYALNRGGFIILGRSEAIPHLYRDKFIEVFKKEKIYQKI